MKRIGTVRALLALWREDFAAHDREILSPGFHSLAVYRFGVWARERDGRTARWLLVRLARLLGFLAANAYGIEIHAQTPIGRRVRFPHRGGIVVHQLAAIGDDVIVRQNVTIGAGSNRCPGAPRIGDRVELGAGAVVFGGIEIGHDSRVGPNVVVCEPVPPFSSVMPTRPEIRPRRSAAPAAGRRAAAG